MQKSQLFEIPPDTFPIIHNLRQFNNHWYITARRHHIGSHVLEISAFDHTKRLVFRVFTTKDNRFSQEFPSGTDPVYGTSKPSSLLKKYEDIKEFREPRHIAGPFLTSKGADEIKYFLKDIGVPKPEQDMLVLDILETFLSEQSSKKRPHEKVRQRHLEYRAKVFEHLPKVPASFFEDAAHSKFGEDQLLFYYSINRKRVGYCMLCKSDVEFTESVRHRHAMACPSCRKTVRAISEGLGRDWMRQYTVAVNVQKGATRDELFIQSFYIERNYTDYRNMELVIQPMSVAHFDFIQHRLVNYNQRWVSTWDDRNPVREYGRNDSWTNRAKIINGVRNKPFVDYHPNCKKSAVWPLLEGINLYSELMEYLQRLARFPAMEYVKRSGFHTLYKQLMFASEKLLPNRDANPIDLSAKNLPDLFGLDMQEIHMLRRLDPNALQLKIYKGFRRNGHRLTGDQAGMIFGIRDYQERILGVTELVSPQRIINYIHKQMKRSPSNFKDEAKVLQVWTDYLNEAVKLEYNLADSYYLFPKKLLEFHKKTGRYIKYMVDEEKDFEIKRIGDHFQCLAFEDEKYFIRPAMGMQELIDEGKQQNNCVGEYADYILKGECIVLFVRQKVNPDYSLATVEYKPDEHRIRQRQVRRHYAQARPEINGFLESWLQNTAPVPVQSWLG